MIATYTFHEIKVFIIKKKCGFHLWAMLFWPVVAWGSNNCMSGINAILSENMKFILVSNDTKKYLQFFLWFMWQALYWVWQKNCPFYHDINWSMPHSNPGPWGTIMYHWLQLTVTANYALIRKSLLAMPWSDQNNNCLLSPKSFGSSD